MGHVFVIAQTDGLIQAAQTAQKTGTLPPVHLWDPPFCGNLDMEIRRDGTWFYQGTPIGRPAMVRLFSTILKREGDKFFLVTPVEKVGITVEDAPFVAVDFDIAGTGKGQSITFTTNVGDRVTAGSKTPIRVHHTPSNAPAPYVTMRAGLDALIDRKSFYRLVDIGQTNIIDDVPWFGVWSDGTFFKIIPVSELSL